MTEEVFDLDPFDPEDEARLEGQRLVARESDEDAAQRILRDRRDAYIRFFSGTGTSSDKRVVMADLRRFCRGGQTAWAADPREHALLTGRQEVYQRIVDHTELAFDDLWERYS